MNMICVWVHFTHGTFNEIWVSFYSCMYFDLGEMKRVVENGLVHEGMKLDSNFHVPLINEIRNEEFILLG
jgi:hypothetical protein